MMIKKKIKKEGITNWLLENSDKIVYGLMFSLLTLIFTYLFLRIPSQKAVTENFNILYGIILFIQVLICFSALIFSKYIRHKTWNNELSTKSVGTFSYKDKSIRDEKIANEALSQFKVYWFWIWFSWLLLYIAYFINHLRGNETKIVDFFLNSLSNANTLMLLISYLILFEITVPDKETGITGKPNWALWTSLFLIITFFEIIIRRLSLFNMSLQNYLKYFDLINGIISGAVMALFVGAFENEFIKPKKRYTVSLYLYMAIQAISPNILNEGSLSKPLIKLLISFTAMICKIILFLFVFKQIKTGKLFSYFMQIRKLHYDFDNKMNEFLKLPGIAMEKKQKKCKNGCRFARCKKYNGPNVICCQAALPGYGLDSQ